MKWCYVIDMYIWKYLIQSLQHPEEETIIPACWKWDLEEVSHLLHVAQQ